MAIIDFDNVGFTYDGERFVLDGVTFSVQPGEFVCVLGGNGSGKSTLAKHIDALLLPDRGTVRIGGRDTSEDDNLFFVRSTAGMVFQNPDDQLVASLIENDVAFGPENMGVPAPELRERVTESLAQVGLQGFERKETTALSGGQKQRVAIAGVLAMSPQILVLDEASAMLDPRGRSGLMRVCRELHDQGLTIVMITHFMEEAAHADRVYVLDRGRIALEGTPGDVLTDPDALEGFSLDVPFAVRMSRALQKRGVPVSVHVSDEELADEVAELLGCATGAPEPSAPEGNESAAQATDAAVTATVRNEQPESRATASAATAAATAEEQASPGAAAAAAGDEQAALGAQSAESAAAAASAGDSAANGAGGRA